MHNLAIDKATGLHARFLATINGIGAIWANLGTIVTQAQTLDEAIKLARMDFELGTSAIFTQSVSGTLTKIQTHKMVIRKDTKEHWGIVGKDFSVMQIRPAFESLQALSETNEANFISAGLLNTAQMFVLMAVPSANIEVTAGDIQQTYLLFCVGFDGSMSRTWKLTFTRVECANTMAMALADGNFTLKIRNTKNADKRMESALELVKGTKANAREIEAKLRKLAARPLKREKMNDILERLFPATVETDNNVMVRSTRSNNIVSDILKLYEDNDGNAFPEQRGTAYNLLNAITNYADHERVTHATETLTIGRARSLSALTGSGNKLKNDAFEVIYELTDGTERVKVMPSLVDSIIG